MTTGESVTGAPLTATGRSRIGAASLVWGLLQILADRVRRRVSRAIARRRMARLRRHPAPLEAALRSARSVVIVCSGNIIRSPFAARLAARAVGEDRGAILVSAGLDAVPERAAHPTAALAAALLGIDLRGHAAARVTPEMVDRADVLLVMDVEQIVEMERRFPGARGKTFLLTCLAPETPLEVRDPVDRPVPDVIACFDHITRALRPVVAQLSKGVERR